MFVSSPRPVPGLMILEQLGKGGRFEHEPKKTMKWALDVWYELWENIAENKDQPSPDVNTDEKDRHLPGLEELPSEDQEQHQEAEVEEEEERVLGR